MSQKIMLSILMVIASALFLAALFGLPIMYLWNWLMTDIFGLRAISFWEAVGLTVMFSILTGASLKS